MDVPFILSSEKRSMDMGWGLSNRVIRPKNGSGFGCVGEKVDLSGPVGSVRSARTTVGQVQEQSGSGEEQSSEIDSAEE